MSRVVMFVLNDVRTDARVLREAATLVGAGHSVTIMGRSSQPPLVTSPVETRQGFEIRRVALSGRIRAIGLRARGRWRGSAAAADPASRPVPRPRPVGGQRGRWVGLVRGLGWLIRWRLGPLAWAANAAAAAPDADVWHGHDLPGLAAAIDAQHRRGGRVVYDAHELYLDAGETATVPRWATAPVGRDERRWGRRADAIVTVNDGLAEVLRPIATRQIVVVHNCPSRWTPPSPPSRLLRDAIDAADDVPIALYHGAFVAHRGIEVLLDALTEPGCESVHGVFLGAGSLEPWLRAAVAASPAAARLHLLPAVDPTAVLDWISGADVGVAAIAPSTLNHRLSTPNKVFECIAAGVPVVTSDFPALTGIVRDDPAGSLGRVCDPMSPTEVAAAIQAIVLAEPAERLALRRRCLAAAHERWNWETESARLVDLYAQFA